MAGHDHVLEWQCSATGYWRLAGTQQSSFEHRSQPQGSPGINIVVALKVTHVLPKRMAIKVEEDIREVASNPSRQRFDGMGCYKSSFVDPSDVTADTS